MNYAMRVAIIWRRCVVSGLMISLLTACVATASISNFPKTNSAINFDEISKRDLNGDGSLWTFKGSSEYFVAIRYADEKSLVTVLTQAMENKGYAAKYSSVEGKAIIGERGLRLNEWGAVAGIYFKPGNAQYLVYARVDVTQDITGGPSENHAAALIGEICRLSHRCEQIRQ